jgi:hypothetical protein
LHRTKGDKRPEAEARDLRLDPGRRGLRACGAFLDAFKCREQTNRSLVHCCPMPIDHEPLATFWRARSGDYFHFALNHLRQLPTVATTVGMALALEVIEQMLKNFKPTLNPLTS